jgi:predicted porin
MKKTLFALAAVSAFAGTAQAQSSVTVYGILDVGYLVTKGTEGRASTQATSTAAGYVNGGNLSTSAINSSNLATSRLGFRGTEDLGNGNRAGFVAEIGLTPTSNGFSGSGNSVSTPMGSTYVNNSSVLDSRQMFASLGRKGLGEIRIGRQYTPVHEVLCANNAGQCNAVAGDMMYSGANGSQTLTTANKVNESYQIRASNSVRLSTENIAGFQAAALYSSNLRQNDNPGVTASTGTATSAQGSTDYRMMGLNAAFTGVKNLNISAAWQQTNLLRANAIVQTTGADGTNTVLGSALFALTPSTQGAVDGKQVDVFGNVSYDFGVAKVALQSISLAVSSYGVQTLKRTANQVSVTAPITPTVSTFASYGMGKRSVWSTAGVLTRERDFSGFQLGGTYSLSKRTALYGIYGQATQKADTVGQTDFKDQQYAVGVRHTF